MPEEEKTSISLTQRLRQYSSGGRPLKVPRRESVLIVCISFSVKRMLLAGRQQPVANSSTSIHLAGWLPHVAQSHTHGLCVKYHGLLVTAFLSLMSDPWRKLLSVC